VVLALTVAAVVLAVEVAVIVGVLAVRGVVLAGKEQ
jgi:hypothetical protein